ncbi:hypothetical protein MVEN_02546800 [Mycena venus]|uniref:Uncharacterized protein n=1 Tax=Mycena venus TaxID=2733690 RepID=A0A8H6WUD7_9AGAR|nr:hypothetical protein MVEN_02546800 [Mycena venus]
MTPDILHQLQKGVFSDHISKWAASAMEETEEERKKELDGRFRTMPMHPTLRHFSHGISGIKQWTGSEYRDLAKTFVGALVETVDPEVVEVTRHVIDYMEYSHFELHTDESLAAMEQSLEPDAQPPAGF